ncbi:MAG: thiamine-phosphate kinase [Steroidobacteraceae bacterium]|nr:thiamine-phosphate kinase [Nevskiaceae bacterium]MCP5339541.1 thiamine-phosphate kinase [Nevskiaceae bacterium]MCP5359167.1 thiamine-phosphate kinase [Nevskiaceae bacterium]MCP5466401.1 thiamine-phosphate kinase [Nevskiaceae bacterium]MCP5471898.1 thiamine-phosphate kinase [Nevskiaceae bacterium]
MALSEFELIRRYFGAAGAAGAGMLRDDVVLGIGDDGAILRPPPGQDLVAVIDTVIEGVHFPIGSAAAAVGHRALAVNLSDIAAMGATPAWALLSLSLPQADEAWLQDFATGLGRLAGEHGVALVGGDTTCGALAVGIQLLGFVPANGGLRRSSGAPGDWVFVSGTPGDAAAGLAIEMGQAGPGGLDEAWLRDRFLYPTPRVALGGLLRELASACIDVSDGLAGDLGKLAAASGCGAELDVTRLPLSPALIRTVGAEQALERALNGGDDYELCFTIPDARLAEAEARLAGQPTPVRRIGRLVSGSDVKLQRAGAVTGSPHAGFDHFAR